MESRSVDNKERPKEVVVVRSRLVGCSAIRSRTAPSQSLSNQEREQQELQTVALGSIVTIEFSGKKSKIAKVMLVVEKKEQNPDGVDIQVTMDSPIAQKIIGKTASKEEIIVSPHNAPDVIRAKVLAVTNPSK